MTKDELKIIIRERKKLEKGFIDGEGKEKFIKTTKTLEAKLESPELDRAKTIQDLVIA